MLGGLDQPTSGEVFIQNQSLQKINANQLAQLRNQYLGFVYQFHHLMADFSALENVMMPMLIGKQNRLEAQDCAEKMLTAVGLSHRISHRPSALSGGEDSALPLRAHWSIIPLWCWLMNLLVT